MADMGPIYAEGRTRLTELVASADPEQHTVRVPGCPEWVVRDVIAHVTGVCADVLAGNIAGVATEAWTAAQVAERKDRSLPEILAEWSEVAPQVDEPRDGIHEWLARPHDPRTGHPRRTWPAWCP